MRRRLAIAVVCLAFVHPAKASTEALVQLCRVWSTVKFLDPQLMTRAVDWDAPLIHAIPAARAANTPDDAAAAIDAMLRELHDPVTRLLRSERPAAKPELFEWHDDVLVVNIGPYTDSVGSEAELFSVDERLAPEIAKARAIVYDIRTRTTETAGWVLDNEKLSDRVIAVPALRYVFRSGYPPQEGTTSGGYYSAIQVVDSPAIAAAPKDVHVPSRVVIVVDSEVPPRVAALWRSGTAAIVSTRPLSAADVAQTTLVDIGNGWKAAVRVAEAPVEGLTADAVADEASAMTKALALAHDTGPRPVRAATHEMPAVPVISHENAYADMVAPDASYRLLALFRYWSIIDRFYPYKNLIGDWDAVLPEFIPRFEAAEGADAYARTVIELEARVEDGHSGVWGPMSIWNVIGARVLPVEVRPIEGHFIVTAKDASVSADADIRIGDEIVNVDGEPLADRVKRLWKYFTGSTEAARRARVVSTALRGPKDSVAELGVVGADGKARVVKIARVRTPPVFNSGAVWRLVTPDIGYIDLTRLTPAQVDEAMAAVKNTKALIFDMRGYPKGTAWAIAPRLNVKNSQVIGAIFSRPEISVMSEDMAGSRFSFDQPIPKSDKPKYGGRTVMLIDERTISQAEHTGLFFEAANGTKFIGSNSAGANGDVTNVVLPGGIYINFTGHEVRHADGRQLQRIGLVPDVRVAPTIAGIRAGKDEVLDAAIAYLSR